MSYTLEFIMRVYDDSTGEYYQISQDPDGLDLVELSSHEKGGEEYTSFVMTLDAADKFQQALAEYIIRERGRLIKEKRERNGDDVQSPG
ncbi:MAG: hypothetical protein WC372_10590 [Candidatus Neomarinimicrobiota bacterium]|jgi:hypothetical protein